MRSSRGFFLALILSVIFCVGIAMCEPYTTGWGRKLSVGAAPASVTNLSLVYLSVYNADASVPISVLVNCDTNFLTNAVVQGTSITVPPSKTFTFDNKGNGLITKMSYVATSPNANVYIAGY